MFRRAARTSVIAAATAAAAGLAACEAPERVHGNMPEKDEIAKIDPGRDTQRDVMDVLGAPSTRSPFADKTWYYVGAKKSQIMFFRPEVKERRVLKVSFADNNTVANTKVLTEKDGRSINPVDRITPSPGRDLSLLEQLLGNLGRFKQPGGGSPGPVGPGGPGQ